MIRAMKMMGAMAAAFVTLWAVSAGLEALARLIPLWVCVALFVAAIAVVLFANEIEAATSGRKAVRK